MKFAKTFGFKNETYTFGHWAPDKATEIFAWLVSSMGPSVKGAFQAFTGNSALLDTDVKDIHLKMGIDVLDVIVRNLSGAVKPEEYAMRMKQIFTDDITCNGKPIDFNFHFRGRQKDMHRLAIEVLKFQYADFLEDVLSNFTASAPAELSLHSNPAH